VENRNDFTFNADAIRIPRKGRDRRYLHKYSPGGKVPDSVWHIERLVWTPKKHKNGFHPTKKPPKLIERMMLVSSNPYDTILDLFLGSGTTLECCMNNNRNGVGFEINPDYEPIIRKRIMADIPAIESFGVAAKDNAPPRKLRNGEQTQ
jgi:site-specific DNA-methyltransferase (adenine-specific)